MRKIAPSRKLMTNEFERDSQYKTQLLTMNPFGCCPLYLFRHSARSPWAAIFTAQTSNKNIKTVLCNHFKKTNRPPMHTISIYKNFNTFSMMNLFTNKTFSMD